MLTDATMPARAPITTTARLLRTRISAPLVSNATVRGPLPPIQPSPHEDDNDGSGNQEQPPDYQPPGFRLRLRPPPGLGLLKKDFYFRVGIDDVFQASQCIFNLGPPVLLPTLLLPI